MLLDCLQRSIFENIALGTVVVKVSATDADSGLFSVIEYSLVDGEGKFGINPATVSEFMVRNGHALAKCAQKHPKTH